MSRNIPLSYSLCNLIWSAGAITSRKYTSFRSLHLTIHHNMGTIHLDSWN